MPSPKPTATAKTTLSISPPAPTPLASPGQREDNNQTGDLDLTEANAYTIQGAGADVTTVDAALIDRVFDLLDSGAQLSSPIYRPDPRDGHPTGRMETCGPPQEMAAGRRRIRSAGGTVDLFNCQITNCVAGDSGMGDGGFRRQWWRDWRVWRRDLL